MTSPDPAPPPANRILAALPSGELQRLLARMELLDYPLGQVVMEVNRPIEHVWFVEEGVISILSVLSDGSAVEVATVGSEGMAGIPVFLEAERMAGQAFWQVPGRAYRLPAAALHEELARGGALRGLLGRYTQALITLAGQTSACNRLHPMEQRCARWFLLTHDRVPGDTFELTHLIVSQMLGVRRATVTEAAGALQARGLIEYARGVVRIVDRAGLEAACCECYAVIAAEFARLVEGRSVPSPLDGAPFSADGLTTTRDPAPRGEDDDPAAGE